MPLSYVK